jgi:hypothetical protein
MYINQNNNEEKENIEMHKSINNSIFKKVELQIKLNKTPQKRIKDKEIKLPYIKMNREMNGRKMAHLQNFCTSIYSIYGNMNYKNNKTIDNIFDIKEQMNDILNDSKLKAIDDIKHYFLLNKFPNEVNFRKKSIEDLYKRIFANRAKIKQFSLKKIKKIKDKSNNNQIKDNFTLITTLDINKEKTKEEDKHIKNHLNRYRKYNFEDYADNKLVTKHPILYQLNQFKSRNNKIPLHKSNNYFNEVVEISKLIPNKAEINKENKINNYDDYMRMKELKIIK